MQTYKKLIITTICAVSSLSLFTSESFDQNYVNNTANTVEHPTKTSIDSGSESSNYISSPHPTNNANEEMNSLLNQVGEAARKIAIGGANVLSNISGEIKKGLE